MPFENFRTGRAEVGSLIIGSLDLCRSVHDTAAVSAMGHTKAMAEFMKRRLFRSLRKQVLVGRLIIKLESKPMNRYDCASPFHGGQSKDIFEDGHEKVYLGHANEAQDILRAVFYQIL